ncbi:Complex III assembly protein translocase and chaperone [Rhodotorula kratochvilovae]
MVSSAVFLAACIVPPVCALFVVAWTLGIYLRIKRLAAPPVAVPPPTLPLPTVQLAPAHPVFNPALFFSPHPPHTSGTPLDQRTTVLRADFLAALPPPPPPPPEPRFSIRTTLARDGSRVLARQPTGSSTGHAGASGSGSGEGSEERSRPERTRRDRRTFGIGDADDERAHGWEVVDALDCAQVAENEGEATLTPRRGRGLRRRRNSTWSARDFDGVLPSPVVSPSSLSSPARTHPYTRPGPRPLPPGAGYLPAPHDAAPTSDDGARAASETSGEAFTPLESSQESGAPMLLRQGTIAGRSPPEQGDEGREVVVRPLRESGWVFVQHAPQCQSSAGWELETDAGGAVTLAGGARSSARPLSDEYSLSARSSQQYFGTSVVPLPPGTPSGSSSGHGGVHRQSAGSNSTYEAVFTDFPGRSPAARARRSSPGPRSALRPPQARDSLASTGTAALEELEGYAASLGSSLSLPPGHGSLPPPRASTLPVRAPSHGRRQGSAPWFATPAAPSLPAPPPEQQEHEREERLDTEKEREAILAARRPISWLARQASNGSLPEGVLPGFGNLATSAAPSATQPTPSTSAPAPSSSSSSAVDLADQAAGVAAVEAPGGLRGLVQSALDSNPYFSAGFGLMALGVGAQVLRRSAVHAATLAQRRLLVSLEISSKDPSYLWFLQWMSAQSARQAAIANQPLRGFEGLASRIRSHELAVETKYEQRKDGSSSAEFSLVPGPGTHYFRYHNAWFQVKRERATNMLDLNSGTPWETVHLTTLSRDRKLFSNLLSEARELAQQAVVGRTVVYTAWGAEWRPFGQPREKRLLESVVLDKGVKERIVDDVWEFLGRGKWYHERGIPYRRGYLLHGPPGSGKSSFIQALAGSLDYNICVLNLSERGLTDDKLNHLLANAPERCFMLLEDIDAAFSTRAQTGEAGFNSNVTFSGLLNALDGVASSTSQRILFLTTNHLEKLDAALIRPGRVDLKELIDDATAHQAEELFTRFYHDEPALNPADFARLRGELVAQVAAARSDGTRVSMAALQGHFIRHSAREAVQEWPELRRMAEMDAALQAASPEQERVRFASSP